MTRLADLRHRLSRLKRRRRRVRLETGYSGLTLAVLGILAAAFLVDWLFGLNYLQRTISLALCGMLLVWAFRRYTLPWLWKRESQLDMALLVEKHERIDSDLVAALQFESSETSAWGSLQLQNAVIDRVESAGKQIDVMRGLDRRGLRRRLRMLLLVVAVWLGVGTAFPSHVAAFFNRFLLGPQHYPSRTSIDSLVVNGQAVDPQAPGRTPLRIVNGKGVPFEVGCSGRIPDGAEVQLTAERDGLATVVALASTPEHPGLYRGQLPRLAEDAMFRVVAGDAWTDAGRLVVGQLPALEIRLEVVPPPYTVADAAPQLMPTGLRQIVAMEGSRVLIHLRSDKPLKEATATISGQRYPLEHRSDKTAGSEASALHWVLDPAGDTPLAAVREAVRFAIQITDAEGQQLERPLEGVVRVRMDAPPRVAAAVVTQAVLPTAAPTIYLRATDDYGVASLALVREVSHADGQTEEGETSIYALAEGQPPQKNVEINYAFELTPLKLSKGDSVKVTIRATDFRGRHKDGRLEDGKSTSSDPLVLQVTDEQGVLAAMIEADKQSAAELKDMIQRQLGIGESP